MGFEKSGGIVEDFFIFELERRLGMRGSIEANEAENAMRGRRETPIRPILRKPPESSPAPSTLFHFPSPSRFKKTRPQVCAHGDLCGQREPEECGGTTIGVDVSSGEYCRYGRCARIGVRLYRDL